MDKAEQDKQSAIIRAQGEVRVVVLLQLLLSCLCPMPHKSYADQPTTWLQYLQAQSAKLIGQAIQNNPAFLTLRKIEVSPAS